MDLFVCVTHSNDYPCNMGDHHILSNWPADIAKVTAIKEQRDRYYNYN